MHAHSSPNPSKVRFTGPFTGFSSGFAKELTRLGYSPSSSAVQLQLAAHLSRWLAADGLGAEDLSEATIERFLDVRRRDYNSHHSLRALTPLLDYLRRMAVVPEWSSPGSSTARERLVARFGTYLRVERRLSTPVIQAYSRWVRPFVEGVVVTEFGQETTVDDLQPKDITRFLVTRLPGLSRKSAQMTACALRSFLRFLQVEGITTLSLAEVVPAVAFWKLAGLPRSLTPSQVEALLGACDRSTSRGHRDYAVITCLVRLGLRCSEAAALELDDIDWHAGIIIVHGKGGRTDRLPLPVDVGEALVDYLVHGRPVTSVRTLFVRARAPFTALMGNGLSCIVARAAARTGLGVIYAHQLRHTAATRALNAGASLEQVAQLLRHVSVNTTVIYAKTDLTRLARLARPWPTGTIS